MTLVCPNSLGSDLFTGKIVVGTTVFRVLLLAATYTFNRSHSKRSDIISHEIAAGGGYTSGGVIVSASLTPGSPTRLSLGAVNLTAATTARYAAYVVWRGGAANQDEFVALLDWMQAEASPFNLPAQHLDLYLP